MGGDDLEETIGDMKTIRCMQQYSIVGVKLTPRRSNLTHPINHIDRK